jgi:hypothetical protein
MLGASGELIIDPIKISISIFYINIEVMGDGRNVLFFLTMTLFEFWKRVK